jgi:DNA-binding CsgD family transcriptional regulator/tetratricopeptide (TPR) repeat protein
MGTSEPVGRDAVLRLLSEALTAPADRGGAFLLLGEPGIGKTTCLAAAEAMAREAGHLTLGTAGNKAETKLPFAGLHRLLRPLLASTDTLPDVQRRALRTVLGLHEGGPADRFVISVAVLNLLRDASAHRTLLITADEIEWLDQDTRHILAFVTRQLDRQRVVVVATSSAVDGLPDLRDVFQEVHLPRLDEPAAGRVLDLRAPQLDDARREWVLEQAAGHPLALIELAQAPPAPGGTPSDPTSSGPLLSPALRRTFGVRVQDLTDSGRDVVLVAAVAAGASLPEILAAATVLSGRGVTATVLEGPQSLGLLRFDETRVHFTHPLVKAAIAQRESASRRQAAHRALGAVITVSAYRRAWHRALGTAKHDDAIAAELEAATSDIARRGDIGAAITALERAAQLSTKPVERGRRQILAARYAARLGRPDTVARLLTGAAGGELSAFDQVRAELLHEDFQPAVMADSNRVIQLCTIARRAEAAGDRELALDLAEAAARRRCAAPLDSRARSDVIALAGSLAQDSLDARVIAVLALADPIGNGRTALSELSDLGDETAITSGRLSAYAVAARAVGDYAVAARLLDRAEIELRARGLFGQLARNLCVAAEVRLELGDWDRAAAALTEFATLSGAAMSTNHGTAALLSTARTMALRGDPAAAFELISEAEHSPAVRGGSRHLAQAQIVRGIANISAGKPLEAYAALSRVLDPLDTIHHFREQFGAVTYLAEMAVRTGRQDHARDVVERLRPIAETSGSPLLQTHLVYATAVLAPDDVAEQSFLAGLASPATDSLWARARLQLAYGRWLRRQHRVTQSRGPLQTSLATLEQLGAQRWAEEARTELEASGVHGDEDHDLPVSGLLSAQELKIARFAALGMSNREIAERLALSPRTVGSHLYRIFPKLQISTRSQIAARLSEEYADTRVHPSTHL